MKKFTPLSRIITALLIIIAAMPAAYAQHQDLPDFLKEKLTWQEKLVVIYAPEEQQNLIKEQLAVLYPYVDTLRREKITVVQIPMLLSASNKLYLKNKLRYQKNRLNIWVIDEKGNLRMSSTRATSAEQFMRVLDADTRARAGEPGAVALTDGNATYSLTSSTHTPAKPSPRNPDPPRSESNALQKLRGN